MNELADYKVLLGSGSPRRKELLAAMGVEFEQIKIKDVDETYPADMTPEQVPVYLSQIKADAYKTDLRTGELLITADTVVILNGEILGKPLDEEDACRMIGRLSGNTHKVVTGVTLTTPSRSVSFSDTTIVKFNHLTDNEILNYVANYHPLDKAGAYGVQEWIGMVGISGIDGCFYNVMGLPTPVLYRELKRFLSAEKRN